MSTERNEIQYASRAFQHDLVPTGRKGIMPSCREKEKIKLDVKCKQPHFGLRNSCCKSKGFIEAAV